ncbi:MAG: DoxX family protein [Candidatus Binatia bacterium]
MNIALWIVQILLALLFLLAGVTKFLMPYEKMIEGQNVVLPHWFFLFIGTCEVLGGLGLVLPWLLKIRPGLTPLAAWLLLIIMIGAAVTGAITAVSTAILPLVIGLLLIFVGWGRSRNSLH